ncbi:MAG: hypothetical protein C0501_31385 [Isosphaera sp.]|nr:hypothetical protein [Isosphaera sp.]
MRLPSPRLAAVGLAVLAAAGCGGPRVVPVSGRVLIDGRPVEHGFVRVAPDGHRAATGKLGPGGRFTLTTTDPDDGCVTGTHPAEVIALETLGPGAQKWHAPKAYGEAGTSGLTVSITGPTDDLAIDLTWGGGKPFVERFGKE